jgi:hypothetical protein
LPLPEHFTRVGLGNAVDNLHQRAFTRTVFTEQGVYFTWGDAQVDGIVGQATGITFADAAQLQARGGRGVGHDRLGLLGVVPVDKAISWPLSQEPVKRLPGDPSRRATKVKLPRFVAPIKRKAFDQAPVLLVKFWLKNEQSRRSQAAPAAKGVMNGLSTGCSTVFVRNRKTLA